MKQFDLFGSEFKSNQEEKKYSLKIEAPIYEPKNEKPHILSLMNEDKSKRLIQKIKSANVSEDEKHFLIEATKRHTVFNYELIADYYAHSNKEMQDLMEQSALVIIDFGKAVELGFVKLSEEIKKVYLTEYNDTNNEG